VDLRARGDVGRFEGATMTRVGSRLLGVAALCAVSAFGCSSSDSGGATPTGPQPYKPPGNGQPTTEADACARVTKALDDRSAALGCTSTHPVCPQYLEQSTHGVCYQYDDGTVSACEAFIAQYTACSDFTDRPCVVSWIDGTTCETPDAAAE
jgi:hypothetical protein